MSKFIHACSVQFTMAFYEDERKYLTENNPKQRVLDNTRKVFKELKGHGLDFIVFCESIEAIGMKTEDAESLNSPGEFLSLYQEFADKEKCAVAGSIKLTEDGKIYNSIVFIDKGGRIAGRYHKCNLTQGEIEAGLTPGSEPEIADMTIGRIGGAICFDLNFEWLRKKYVALKPDIIAFSSNFHGGLMENLWAYECRSFFISALPFTGGGIIDPLGTPVKLTDCYNTIAKAYINLDRIIVHLDFNKPKFAEIEKKYKNKVMIQIPPNLGSAIIYSITDEFTAQDIADEFQLELLDDYFNRAIAFNNKARNT